MDYFYHEYYFEEPPYFTDDVILDALNLKTGTGQMYHMHPLTPIDDETMAYIFEDLFHRTGELFQVEYCEQPTHIRVRRPLS